MLLDGARSVIDLNVEQESKLAEGRRALWSKEHKDVMLRRVREIAGVRPADSLPAPRVREAGRLERDGYAIRKVVIIPEPGIWLPALVFEPAKFSGDLYLYLHGEGKQVDAGPGGPIEKLVRQGHVVCAVDLRGIGETRGKDGGRGWQPYFGGDWKDYFLAYMLEESFVGMRAEDALVCARYFGGPAGNRSGSPKPFRLIAIGEAGPVALHAAALEPNLFWSVRIERSVGSWSDVVRTPVTRGQLNNAIHGALRVYDLPDLVATLGAKCTIVDPINAAGEPVGRK
jgi:hypothetical protein